MFILIQNIMFFLQTTLIINNEAIKMKIEQIEPSLSTVAKEYNFSLKNRKAFVNLFLNKTGVAQVRVMSACGFYSTFIMDHRGIKGDHDFYFGGRYIPPLYTYPLIRRALDFKDDLEKQFNNN